MSRAAIPAWAPPRRRALLRLPPDLGLLVTVVVILAVSGGLLWTLGINYDGLTGSAAHKIHPSTYLAVALICLALVRAGNPVAYVVEAVESRPASVFIAVAGVAFLLHIVLRKAPGMAGALDTFLLPGLVGILIARAGAPTMRRIETLLHAVMLANALLGLVEFGSGHRFFPYRLDGAVFETDTRSAALQGHPLANATLTACYVIALIAGGGDLKPTTRLGLVIVQLAALVGFGGRSAMVVTLFLGGGYGLVLLHRSLSRGRIALPLAAAGAVLASLVPVAIGGLAYAGFFDKLIGRFMADGGSANARVEMFVLFEKLQLRDVIFGPDTTYVETLRRINGLEWGIENPIVRVALYHGAFMTVVLTAATVLFLWEVSRQCRRGVALPMLAFAILTNTFESIGGKSTLIAKFAILLLALYRPLPGAPGDAAGRRASSRPRA